MQRRLVVGELRSRTHKPQAVATCVAGWLAPGTCVELTSVVEAPVLVDECCCSGSTTAGDRGWQAAPSAIAKSIFQMKFWFPILS